MVLLLLSLRSWGHLHPHAQLAFSPHPTSPTRSFSPRASPCCPCDVCRVSRFSSHPSNHGRRPFWHQPHAVGVAGTRIAHRAGGRRGGCHYGRRRRHVVVPSHSRYVSLRGVFFWAPLWFCYGDVASVARPALDHSRDARSRGGPVVWRSLGCIPATSPCAVYLAVSPGVVGSLASQCWWWSRRCPCC